MVIPTQKWVLTGVTSVNQFEVYWDSQKRKCLNILSGTNAFCCCHIQTAVSDDFFFFQRQVVSLDEEADNPAFTENWTMLVNWRKEPWRWATLIFFCIFTSLSTKIWNSKPVSGKLEPLYPHRWISALQWKNQGETFDSGCTSFYSVHQIISRWIPQYKVIFLTCYRNCDPEDITEELLKTHHDLLHASVWLNLFDAALN